MVNYYFLNCGFFNNFLINHTHKNSEMLDIYTSYLLFFSSRLCIRDRDIRWHAKTASVGKSCLSSWLSMRSFTASICHACPWRWHWGLVSSATLSLTCSCWVIQSTQSATSSLHSAYCRVESTYAEAGSAKLQPAHCVYIPQINTNMAGEMRSRLEPKPSNCQLQQACSENRKGWMFLWSHWHHCSAWKWLPHHSQLLRWFLFSIQCFILTGKKFDLHWSISRN